MANVNYIVRHRETLEVIDRGFHDRSILDDVLKAWGVGRYELIETSADFTIGNHYLDDAGDTQNRTWIDPKFSVASARGEDIVTISNLTPGTRLKVNSSIMVADADGKIKYASRSGDDFIEALHDYRGAYLLPDRDLLQASKKTIKGYLGSNKRADSFFRSRPYQQEREG